MNDHIEKIKFFDAAAERWNEDIDRASLKRVIELLNYKNNEVVLDVGCGIGILFPYFQKQKVIGMDFSEKMLKNIPANLLTDNIRLLCADVHSIPLDERMIDHVVCFSVFPHFSNHQIALKELHRVLKIGGTIVIFHLAEPDVINNIHRSVGGAVANDFLPDMESLEAMISEYFVVNKKIQNPSLILVHALKNS